MNHAPWLIRIGLAVAVTITAAGTALALPAQDSTGPLATCTTAQNRPDPVMAADGYVQAAYRLVCDGAISTGITLGLYFHAHGTSAGVMVAQTRCTAAGTTVDCQISAPCRTGGWEVTLGTDATWSAGYRVPDFGWQPFGEEWATSSCPRFIPGVQTLVFGDGS